MAAVTERSKGLPALRRPSRRALALSALAAAFIGTATAWLAASGATGPTITPPTGLSPTGAVAEVTTLTSSVTRTNGNAYLQTGVAVARLDVQESFTKRIRVSIEWTNAADAGQVLNNPNAQISLGLYHPIHKGACNTGAGTTVDSPLVNVTDTDGVVYCMALDQGSTGSPAVSSTGKLLLARNAVAGWMRPAATLASSPSDCASVLAADNPTDSDVYCQPATAGTGQRSLYVVASIVTPGGTPQGQNPSPGNLDLFVKVSRNG